MFASDLWWYPNCPALGTVHLTLSGCQLPIHPIFLAPLCVFFGKIFAPHLFTTPLYPLPLVTPRISIHSWLWNNSPTLTSFSKWSLMNWIFYLISPPFTWTYIIFSFFCLKFNILTCVWRIALTTSALFTIFLTDCSIAFFPF